MTRFTLPLFTILVAVACVTGACSPSLRELAVRIPTYEISYVPDEGDSMAGPLRDIQGRLENWGVTVIYTNQIKGFGGTDAQNLAIGIKADMPVNGQFEVLAHEGAHLFQPQTIQDWAQREVFAEAVALGVADYYGHPYKQSAANYLAGYKQGLMVLELLKVDIEFAVQALTGQVKFEGFWR